MSWSSCPHRDDDDGDHDDTPTPHKGSELSLLLMVVFVWSIPPAIRVAVCESVDSVRPTTVHEYHPAGPELSAR